MLPQDMVEAVWKRDGYKCKRCGRQMNAGDSNLRTGGPLDIHHKHAKGPRHKNAMSALVTICKSCHDATHEKGEVEP